MQKSKKIFIETFCCVRRRKDAQQISNYFLKNGYDLVNKPGKADYIIFFTCGFVNEMIDRCLNKIKKLQKYDAELIVAGCLPDIAEDRLQKVFDGEIIPTKDLKRIDKIFNYNKIKFGNIKPTSSLTFDKDIKKRIFFKKYLTNSKTFKIFNEKVLFKIPFFGGNFILQSFNNKYLEGNIIIISRGCVNNCSYCAIRKAVGPLKSKPITQCVQEFLNCLKKNQKQFILEADDVGVYGQDIKNNIAELLDEITKIEGSYIIRLGYTHPKWLIKHAKEISKVLKREKIKSIFISIQSGSNRILNLMNRDYTREDIIKIVYKFRKTYPEFEIGAQFIVGFPTETTEEFNETYELMKKLKFDFGSVFPYSEVENIKSAKMHPKVTEKEKYKRMKIVTKYIKKNNDFLWKSKRGIGFFNK